LLDRLLLEAGVPRERVAVLNTVKCRPPGNRTPKALGSTAVSWFLGRGTKGSAGSTRKLVKLGEARGRVHTVEVGGREYDVVLTYHPAAAIRFGPAGAPLAALREDLKFAAGLLA
jgi:uracil-DNA glycosylase